MSIFVDRLVRWPQQAAPGAERYFGDGKPSCHMWTDGDDAELIAFARKIGLKPAWIQRKDVIHFDLTPSKRALALRNGAIERELTLDDFHRLRHMEGL